MGKIYCLNEKIEQSVDGYLKTIHNPIYFTVKSVYEKAFSTNWQRICLRNMYESMSDE